MRVEILEMRSSKNLEWYNLFPLAPQITNECCAPIESPIRTVEIVPNKHDDRWPLPAHTGARMPGTGPMTRQLQGSAPIISGAVEADVSLCIQATICLRLHKKFQDNILEQDDS